MKIYEFENAGVRLHADEGVLKHPDGTVVDLRPQSREVLRLLVQAPQTIITKAQFTDAVWEGRQVSEDSLVQCIAEIRSALGDNDRTLIQTVPRKGYRFNPPAATKAPEAPGRRQRFLLIAAVALVLVAGLAVWFWPRTNHATAPVVAVLPLDDLSAAPHQGYLHDALSEGIITELARFPQFRVVARNSSFQFRANPTDVREIGAVLGAGFVVEGSQQYDGEKLRVTVQLVETGTGAHLFSDQFDRDIQDLFVVQDEIVRHVASVVGQSILTEMPQRAARRDVDSLLRGLQARKIMSQLSYENWQKAIALEEISIREEPDSAWGYIGKSLMLVPPRILAG